MGIIFLLEQMFIWRKHWLKRQQKKRERLCIQVFILGILGVGVTESELMIRQDILREILKDVVRSVERYGVKILIFMNGHEANRSVIKYAIREIQDETDVKVLGMFYPGMEEIYDKYMETPTWGGMFHACEFETSLMLAVKPETVHMERAVQEYPVRPTTYGMDNTSIGELSVSGTYGNPVPATEEKGEMMLEQFTENISAVIEECVKKLVREET